MATPPEKPKIRHDWYQTDSHVVLTVLLKNAPEERVKVQYGERSLSVSSPLPQGSEYSLELMLAHPILPDMCSHCVTASKIEIKLRKRDGLRWARLECDEEDDTVMPIPQAVLDASGPARPPPVFRKDWDKLEKEIAKEAENEKPEGEAALNALFQEIYSNSSDEVKKAMNKSFLESGGTVLSTNWSQVGNAPVECKPPEGLEFKKWDS